jgi:thiamine-monophosphate kinase
MASRRKRPSESSQLAKIERAFGRTVNRPKNLPLGIGDDAALFHPTTGCETVLTCDWFLEGTHFLRDKHPPDAVGWKSLARAASDVAAMGGTPRCFLLSLAIPQAVTGAWLDRFLGGLSRASRQFACVLAGGDTTRREEILINITVIGEVSKGRALRRDGARHGDTIYVSGRLGEAERGLQLLGELHRTANRSDARLRKHLYPEPRLALGAWLAENGLATAAMDLSDGLSTDLRRLCAASGVGARIDAEKLPVVLLPPPPSSRSRSKRRGHKIQDEALQLALHGGDDYELLFAVPKGKELQIPPVFQGTQLLSIGEITASKKIVLIGQESRPIPLNPGGWDPFRANKKG